MSGGECYIIGSGPSLLALTAREKAHLNAHPRTLAMNKYLLFWEKIGVWPKAVFLADHHFPAQRVFLETLVRMNDRAPVPQYYVSRYYRNLFASPCPDTRWRKTEQQMLRKNGLRFPWSIRHPGMHYFHHELWSGTDFFWARTLKEKLFFWRSSLVTAINVASIIWPGRVIKLLGVDLGSPESFYEEEIKARPELLDATAAPAREQQRHFTMIDNGFGTVLTKMPDVVAALREQGGDLVCCNPASAIVTEGICSSAPVIGGA